jgi:hypothetical protein
MKKKKELLTSNSKAYHSILQKHEEKMVYFNNKSKVIKEYTQQINGYLKIIEDIQKQIAVHRVNNQMSKLMSLESQILNANEKIRTLKQCSEDLQSGKTENEYILNVFPLINEYLELDNLENEILKNQNSDSLEQQLFEINFKKKNIADDYLKIVDPNFISYRNIMSKELTICKDCNGRIVLENGFGVCNDCGSCFHCVHESEELSYKEMQEFDHKSQFTYEKRIHLSDWIKRFTSKENKEIPQEILDKVILEAKKERITDLNLLTEDKVKRYLKKLGLNEYYDNVISIINRINKRQPFVLTKEIEGKIMDMFQQIQEPFEKYKDPSRKNMLSYSFLLNKFFLILGLPEFSRYFFLLKSPDKLRQQDETFKKIVDHMAKIDPKTGWKFFPSL